LTVIVRETAVPRKGLENFLRPSQRLAEARFRARRQAGVFADVRQLAAIFAPNCCQDCCQDCCQSAPRWRLAVAGLPLLDSRSAVPTIWQAALQSRPSPATRRRVPGRAAWGHPPRGRAAAEGVYGGRLQAGRPVATFLPRGQCSPAEQRNRAIVLSRVAPRTLGNRARPRGGGGPGRVSPGCLHCLLGEQVVKVHALRGYGEVDGPALECASGGRRRGRSRSARHGHRRC
jgi:hypothetical protein